MDSIFMNYRRSGTAGYSGRLYAGLRDHFGNARVFRDVDSIPPGTDFVTVIDEAVRRAGVVVAVIGRDWLTTLDTDGKRRIDDRDDFVRLELEAAFRHGTVVIPVLVDRAEVPSARALPQSLAPLSRLQAIELSDERWDYDLGRLITRLEHVVGAPAAAVTATHPVIVVDEHRAPLADAPDATAGTAEADESSSADDDPTGRPRGKRLRRRWAATFLLIVPFVVLLATAVMIAGVRPDRRIVPNVVDQDYRHAVAVMRDAGFVVISEEVTAADRPAGAVVAQKPARGTSAREGTTVILSVARTDKVPVPHVVDRKRSEVEAALRQVGLVPQFHEESSGSVAAGFVIRQSPDSSAMVDTGTTVMVVVSTGPPSTTQVYRPAPPTTARTTPTTRPPSPSTSVGLIHGNDCVPPPGVTWATSPCDDETPVTETTPPPTIRRS